MSFLIAITVLLSISSSSCLGNNNTDLSKFIRKVYQESDSGAVLFVGIDDEFLSEFITSSNFDIPVLTFKSCSFGRTNMKGFSSNAILVVKTQRECHEEQIDLLHQIIPRFRIRKFVIILAFDKENLLENMLFFDKYKFTRIYGMEKGISYTYLPFADKQVQKLADNTPLVDGYKDLNGFSIRTTIQNDIPRVFRYSNKQGQLAVGGCYGQIFIHFLRKHNANFEDVKINNCDGICFPKILNATRHNEVDISMNVYTPIKGFDYSYPMKIIELTFMVAFNGNLDPNQYFLRPFSLTVWLSVGLIFIYIILMDLIKNLKYNLTARDVWKSFSQLLLMMLNSSSGQRIKKDYRFYIQVLVMTFILGNIYNNHFTSFLTVFIKIKEFETIQDLIDNNVRVMVADYELKTGQEMNILPAGSDKLFHPTEYSVYAKERNSMKNTEFAYLIGVDRAEFLIGLQQHFGKPLFHTTREGLSTAYTVFILKEHSPFKEILDIFIIQVLETGLMIKWDRDAITQSLMAGFEISRDSKVQPLHVPLGVGHLVFAWNILAIGLLIALLTFGGEILLKNTRRINCQKKNISIEKN